MYTLFAESDTGNTIRRREGELAQGGTRRHRGRARDRRGRSGRKRGRDPDQLRSVHEPVEPAPHPGRARLVRLRQHGRRHLPDRTVQRRRRLEQHRVGDDDERGPHVDDGHAARHDGLPGRPLVADQRPVGRVRPFASGLDDLDPDLRNGVWFHAVRVAERDPDEPLDGRWTDVARPGRDLIRPGLLRQELDRLRHVAAEPALRELLHRVGRQRGREPPLHEHVDGRRPHVGSAGLARRASLGVGRSAGRAAERKRHRALYHWE